MNRRLWTGLAVVLLVAAATSTRATRAAAPQKLEQAEIFFELNNTDEDLGIHAAIDGGTWTSLKIEGPGERELLNIVSRNQLRRQGLTQLAFESAEPTFDELAPADFFRRFPEGRYEIDGRAQDGGEIVGVAKLSHVMAAPVENIFLSGTPAAENCDSRPLPTVSAPIVIKWDPVTRSHPTVGKKGPVKIKQYQLFVERDGVVKLSLELPPTITQFEVPTEVTSLAKEFKFEIIARTTTNNNTAVESCFRLH